MLKTQIVENSLASVSSFPLAWNLLLMVGFRVTTVDRLSALPTDLAHRILSPLSLPDVTRLGSLSKSCRAFHLSNPIFNFTALPSQSKRSFQKRLELLDSLDDFFTRRENSKIQRFSLNWVSEFHAAECELPSSYDVAKSRIMGLIQNAVSCDVESLNVFFKSSMLGDYIAKTKIKFPPCVFECESLRSLIVDMSCAVVKPPSSSSISKLVFLSITNVTVKNDRGFCKWVSFFCSFLKELVLQNVSGLRNITIESTTLESFKVLECPSACHLEISGDKLEDIHIDWKSGIPYRNSLKISAPNLKHLKWVGYLMKNLYMGEFHCLDEVEISLKLSYDFPNREGDYIRDCDKFLCSIRSVKVLILDQSTLETIFREGLPPAKFYNVWCLRMRIRGTFKDKLVPAVASLFKGVPNLNTLDMSSFSLIGTGTEAFGFSRGYWEAQDLDFISLLKEVTLELTNGSNGIELAWYILQHAQNLKKMIMNYFHNLPHHSSFMKKLKRTRIISNAIVVFQEKAETSRTDY